MKSETVLSAPNFLLIAAPNSSIVYCFILSPIGFFVFRLCDFFNILYHYEIYNSWYK